MAPSRSRDRQRELAVVRQQAAGCKRCDLWRHATQTVFGAGPADADIVFVGEQPGDYEDRQGEPFVGPAGQLFRRALVKVGLDLDRVYLTNAVKHFKWTPRGKRRIHERPNVEEVMACHFWIERELAIVRPRVVVGLGAIAARSLLGPEVRVMRDRGRPLASTLAPIVLVTVHPSSILRAPDAAARRAAWDAFVRDLRAVSKAATIPARRQRASRPREEKPHAPARRHTSVG